MFNNAASKDVLVPSFQAEIPASIHINGKQVPPIDAEGELINISINGLEIRCEKKIPIPSKGQIRFAIGDSGEEVELDIQFTSRLEIPPKGFWPWKRQQQYDVKATFHDLSKEKLERYQKYIHQLLFGDCKPVYSEIE